MKKIKDEIKAKLKEQWTVAVEGYATALLKMWELDAYYGYWIGEEVGGVYDYGGGSFTIVMDDIIYCVDHDVPEDQYMDWQEYICDAAEFGFNTPNLRSWMMGCPRTPPEVFERLRKLKDDLNEAVEEEKKRVKGESV